MPFTIARVDIFFSPGIKGDFKSRDSLTEISFFQMPALFVALKIAPSVVCARGVLLFYQSY